MRIDGSVPHSAPVVLKAHAKINLTLDVLDRRADGYHELRSLLHTIELHDMVTVEYRPDFDKVVLDVTGPQSGGVPNDSTNLVHRAVMAFYAAGVIPHAAGFHIRLEKNIPRQAGLGGGSSDAAATLLAVNQQIEPPFSNMQLSEIAATLGADVPFFLAGGMGMASGFGDRIISCPPLSPPWPLVIVKPPVGVSTAWAYASLDAATHRTHGASTEQCQRALQFGDAPVLHNDFQNTVLGEFSEIATVMELLADFSESVSSHGPVLCGSGAAVFLRVASHALAEKVALHVRSLGVRDVWVTQTTSE